jgi:hypothetical protein
LNELKSIFTFKYYKRIRRFIASGYLIEPFSINDPIPATNVVFNIFNKIIRKFANYD